MSIPAGHSRIVLVGHLGGGETFETGIWVGSAPATQGDTQTAADTAAGNWITNASTGSQALISSDSGYDTLRWYSYTTAGGTATFVAESAIGPAVGTGSGSLPDQVCLVATLLTGAAGRRNRGRMYLPANGLVLTSHQVSNAVVDNAANAIASFAGALGDAVVLSQVAGSARPITDVRVDSVPDIQRRRANKLVATHADTVPV